MDFSIKVLKYLRNLAELSGRQLNRFVFFVQCIMDCAMGYTNLNKISMEPWAIGCKVLSQPTDVMYRQQDMGLVYGDIISFTRIAIGLKRYFYRRTPQLLMNK